ncbi:MAG TPA: M20/M25/M40 family metallo-hydrolase [Armatimonadota bacterium]|jgi:acetylornithine deacetylase
MTVTELCAALTRIPTVEPLPTGAAIDLIAEMLAPAGFTIIHRIDTLAGVEHALLERLGDDPPLLIDGHLDTVPPGDPARWQYAPFSGEMAEGKVWGRGSADDKGPLAAAVMALCETKSSRRLLLSLTGDEELHMRGMRLLLEHPAVRAATQAIALEPTDFSPIHAHKGNARLRVDITGQAAHSSRPWEGRNAIEEKMRLAAATAEWFAAGEGQRRVPLFGDEPSTLVLTREVTPNDAFNIIPERSSYWYNYRPLPGNPQAYPEITRALTDLAQRLDIQANVVMEYELAAFQTPVDSSLIRTLEAVSGRKAGWVAYGTHAGILAVDGRQVAVFGPGSIAVAHQENEYIDSAMLEEGVRQIRKLLQLV